MDRLKPYMLTLEGITYTLHFFCPQGTPAGSDDRWEVDNILRHRGKGEDMAWKVLWKAEDITWEKKGQFVYGCQSDWPACNKKKEIHITISRVSTPKERPPWEKTWPNWGKHWALHDFER